MRLDHAFAYAKASFLVTFAVGRVPHAGSWQRMVRKASMETGMTDHSLGRDTDEEGEERGAEILPCVVH